MTPIKVNIGCAVMLRRMLNRKIYGQKHIPETLVKSWVKHLPKYVHKAAMKDWDICKKENFVVQKSKPTELEVSLNPKRLSEILKLVEHTIEEQEAEGK